MSELNLFVSALVLAMLLPVSVAVLYAMMAGRTQLAPDAAMDHAVLARFDSEAEIDAWLAEQQARAEARRAAVMARYRQIAEQELQRLDPRRANHFRRALSGAAVPPMALPAALERAASAPDAEPSESACGAVPGAEARAGETPRDATPAATEPATDTRARTSAWRRQRPATRQ